MHEFLKSFGELLEAALKRLLSEKHLYQTVEPDFAAVPGLIKELKIRLQRISPTESRTQWQLSNLPALTEHIISEVWLPSTTQTVGPLANKPVGFPMPGIRTFCDSCKQTLPFNPVYEESVCVLGSVQNQSYFLSYECQGCKGPRIRFLVRREERKLRLCGRDPLELMPINPVLPRTPGRFFNDAIVAYHAGQTLAGLFLLRVFIEQFWRTNKGVVKLLEERARATGDEQGSAYQAGLPNDFKSRFPSLPEIYGKLSAAMHTAESDEKLFESACAQIIEHFEARRLFRLN